MSKFEESRVIFMYLAALKFNIPPAIEVPAPIAAVVIPTATNDIVIYFCY